MKRVISVVVALSAGVTVLATSLVAPPASARSALCDLAEAAPGLNGCLPTPDQCATGRYNGVWHTGDPARRGVVDCAGHIDASGIGHIDTYNGSGGQLCGSLIEADAVVTYGVAPQVSPWADPNLCPGGSNPPGYGVRGRGYREPVSGDLGAVASESPEAAEAAAAILQRGGNAVDAAIAATFAVGVARPEMCGIGGGGFLVYRSASGEAAALDFRETAPAAMTPQSLEGEGVFATTWKGRGAEMGHRVVGVPGTVAGMEAAHQRYGSQPWADLVQPAIDLAEGGIRVNRYIAEHLWRKDGYRMSHFPASEETYLQHARTYPSNPSPSVPPFPMSPKLVLGDYAKSLSLIRDQGAHAFYRGEIAQAIVQDMDYSRREDNPLPGDSGLMTAADLENYRAIWREPLQGTYRGAEVTTMPAPSSGGVFTLETLNILENWGLGAQGWEHSSANHIHLLAEAQKVAWADRNRYLADPDFESVPTEDLVGKGYARQRAAAIDMASAAMDVKSGEFESEAAEPAPAEATPTNTTHVSVIDGQENAVAVTCSIETTFGSAVVAPGTGFLLNSEMSDFDAPGTANEAEGGKRPRSSMSPTIVTLRGRPILVVGGQGGTTIPMAVAETISNVIDYGMNIAHALDAARTSEPSCASPGPCQLVAEDARILDEVEAELSSRGHKVTRGRSGGSVPLEYLTQPVLEAVGYDPSSGGLSATSDPRGQCGATAVSLAAIQLQC